MTITSEYPKTHACGAVETFDILAAESYRYQRRFGSHVVGPLGLVRVGWTPAVEALRLAKVDAAKGVRRYKSSLIYGYNPAFAAYGESKMRWVENPMACGLRFVGYADDISPFINHTGWYTDMDGTGWTSGEIVRGAVWQLPARNGRPQFVAGYADPWNGTAGKEHTNPGCISFDEIFEGEPGGYEPASDDEGAREAATRADGIAETMAESEREYQAASGARHRFESMGDEIGDIRRAALALIRDAKSVCPVLEGHDSVKAALREKVELHLRDIRTMRSERAKLVQQFGDAEGWANY